MTHGKKTYFVSDWLVFCLQIKSVETNQTRPISVVRVLLLF